MKLGSKKKQKKTILLIGSHSAARQLIEDYLISYNINVVTSKTVDESVAEIAGRRFFAIIANPLDDYAKLASNLKKTKNFSTPLVLSIILEDHKLGWNPNIFDYLSSPITKDNIFKSINSASDFYGKKISDVLIIEDQPTEEIENAILTSGQYNIRRIASVNELELLLEDSKIRIDLVLINAVDLKEVSWEFCFRITLDRNLRLTPTIMVLPQYHPKNLKEKDNQKLIEIALKANSHPLDILKGLRDRLKIEEDEIISKANLIEEKNEPTPQHSNKAQENIIKVKPTVLIVDDDNDALFTVGEYIKDMNCDTIFAHNGMECLLMLNHVQPDLILLDIMMPQMDGFETIKRIRADNRFNSIPVIALTAYAMLENKEIIDKNGFDDLITKPINSQLFSSKVGRFINSNKKMA